MKMVLKIAAAAVVPFLVLTTGTVAAEKCESRIGQESSCPADWTGDKIAGGKTSRLQGEIAINSLEGQIVEITILAGD